MNTPAPVTQFTCTQCGGELHPDEGQSFVTCPYCSATVYLDKSQVVFHWSLAPTLTVEQARAALARWMSGAQTVKDLDKKAQIVAQGFQYFPLWYFRLGKPDEKERILLEPAAATSVTELRKLALPAGDLQRYDGGLDAQAVPPSVPLEAARQWLKQSAGDVTVRESALVHVPVYLFKYQYKNTQYTALVEAATGSVLANIFPSKSEAPYVVAGLVTALVYLCLALVPVFAGGEGRGVGIAITCGLGALAAPFLFALAVWVASKV